jgi:formate hydrogenlyase transcriptional activator
MGAFPKPEDLRSPTAIEDTLRRVIDTIPCLVTRSRPDGYIDFVNRRWLEFTGLKLEQVLGWGWRAVLHPEDIERYMKKSRAALTSGETLEIEARLRRADREYCWFLIRKVPLRDDQGNIIKWYGTCHDIEELKQATEGLCRSEAELRQILDAIPADVFVLESDASNFVSGNFLPNRHHLEYAGLTLEEAHTNPMRIFHPDDVERLRALRQRALLDGMPFDATARVRRRDGQYRWFLIRLNPLKEEHGRILRWYGTRTDIDDQKRAEDYLRLVIDTIPQQIWSGPADGSLDFCNAQWLSYMGLTQEEAQGEGWQLMLDPEDRDRVLAAWRDSVSTGKPYEQEERHRGADGRYRWFLSRGIPLKDSEGRIVRWYGTNTDIEDRKEAESRLRLVVDTTPAMLYSSRPDGYLDFFNKRWLDYLGLSLDELCGWGWTAAIHPEDLERLVGKWCSALATGEPYEAEARVRGADGQYRWMLLRKVPLRDQAGNIVGWYGSGVDIEDRRQAEDAVRQSEDRLRLVIDTTPAMLHSARPDGYLDFFNKRWLEYVGLPLEAMSGWGWTRVVHPDDIEEELNKWRSSLATGEPFEAEVRVRRADGDYRWMLHRKVPARDGQGNIVKWYGSSTDVEEQHKAREALLKAFNEIKTLRDQLYQENLVLKEEIGQASMFEEIIGTSPPLRSVLAHVERVAPTDSTVLITGETGTGKELVARAIHKRSNRATRAFVSVNCAAIPPTLVASELFGSERGAYTGAIERRLGRFELADGGTIFLDEIGDLPPETQIALLRVLQERTFERVGSGRPIPVNVRVLAATNRDLQAAVERGTFRQDLFYRLNVFPIHVPPLRDRVQDIPLLVDYFTKRYAKKAGKKIKNIKRKTLELLQTYDWPGNIRELQNVIERAVILCDGDTLAVDETWLHHESPKLDVAMRGLGRLDVNKEKEMIESALTETRGRVFGPGGAAAKLGIPRSTLESRIRTLGIDKQRFKSR